MNDPVVRRHPGNPILTRHDVPYPVATVHNAGVALYNNEYVMLFRSHCRNGRSIVGIADSADGYRFVVRPQPFLVPATVAPFRDYEEYGVEDVRICGIDGRYLLTYSAYSRHGVRVALAATTDFGSVERLALVTTADHRNVVIFPEKIGGRYARLERPHSDIAPWSIWISYSPDLVHWGDARIVMRPLQYHWDEMKVGPGATPIKTAAGWLHIYHGVFQTMGGAVYRLGVALHQLDDPSHILGVADDWILQPEDPWEVSGYVDNVVFTCGAIAQADGTVRIYWGAADSVMCVGSARIDDLIQLCLHHSRPALASTS